MHYPKFLALFFLLPAVVNAADFTFDLSTFCDLDKFYCAQQHMFEIDPTSEDDYLSTIVCGKGHLRNIHTHYDKNDGMLGLDPQFEIIAKVGHDCTSDGSIRVVTVPLTSFNGMKSQSDHQQVYIENEKPHIKYKIDLLRDLGYVETTEKTIREFKERRESLVD